MRCWSNRTEFSDWLRTTAQATGALDAACLRPHSLDSHPLRKAFDDWLTVGNKGLLDYVDRSVEQRRAPFATRPWAKSAIVVIFRGDWGNTEAPSALKPANDNQPTGYISTYAFGTDYHRIGHTILHATTDRLHPALGRQVATEICIDSRPVPEVYLAITAGLGRRGLNGLIRTADYGSRVFAGVLFTAADLPEVIRQHHQVAVPCSQCRACLRRCPTGALGSNRPIQVDRCRSYLSMEYRSPLSAQQQRWLGNALFGCDVCTAACPPETPTGGYGVDLDWLLRASRREVRDALDNTALSHAGVTLLRRNAVAILRNDGTPEALALLKTVQDTSDSPVIQETIRHGTPNSARG